MKFVYFFLYSTLKFCFVNDANQINTICINMEKKRRRRRNKRAIISNQAESKLIAFFFSHSFFRCFLCALYKLPRDLSYRKR